jgi:hypothetical protein
VSRSNPSEHVSNPATRFFEWNGEKGLVRYYDKDKKENVDVPLPFTFLLLDQLASVRGWHDPSSSGIYSNEVKDTTKDVLVVKSFKGGTIAEGLYKDIKLTVNNAGGSYTANCYVAFKGASGALQLAAIRFKGAALGGWMEFTKEHRADLYKGAIKIDGFTEGKKGRVIFRVPTFKLVPVSDETNDEATSLDEDLQDFLAAYLTRNRRDAADSAAEPGRHVDDEEMAGVGAGRPYSGDPQDYPAPVTDDDIPF